MKNIYFVLATTFFISAELSHAGGIYAAEAAILKKASADIAALSDKFNVFTTSMPDAADSPKEIGAIVEINDLPLIALASREANNCWNTNSGLEAGPDLAKCLPLAKERANAFCRYQNYSQAALWYLTNFGIDVTTEAVKINAQNRVESANSEEIVYPSGARAEYDRLFRKWAEIGGDMDSEKWKASDAAYEKMTSYKGKTLRHAVFFKRIVCVREK